jgi:hypothetical protein
LVRKAISLLRSGVGRPHRVVNMTHFPCRGNSSRSY